VPFDGARTHDLHVQITASLLTTIYLPLVGSVSSVKSNLILLYNSENNTTCLLEFQEFQKFFTDAIGRHASPYTVNKQTYIHSLYININKTTTCINKKGIVINK